MENKPLTVFLGIIVLFVVITVSPIHAVKKTTDEKNNRLDEQKDKCVSLVWERVAALKAEDWMNLERISRQYIFSCKKVCEPRDIASAYYHIAIANLEQKKYKLALEESNKGIREYYADPSCHLEKVEALIKLRFMTTLARERCYKLAYGQG